MQFRMKYFILIVVLASAGAIIYGFQIQANEPELADKCIGFGTVGLFLVAMPLFLFKESKGKKVKDYMLSDENIRKMQGKNTENTENQ